MSMSIDLFIMFLATERGLSTNYQTLVRRNLETFCDWASRKRAREKPADVTTDGQGDPQYTLTIDKGASVDVGSGVQLVVDWGDGSQPQTSIFVDNGDGTFTVTHALDSEAFVYPVRVFATDPASGSDSPRREIASATASNSSEFPFSTKSGRLTATRV